MTDPSPPSPFANHEDRQVVTVPRWAMLECGGDARDAMVLAQVTWWFQPSQRDGSPRTRRTVDRNGSTWMYVTDGELAEDIGMSESQVRRARRALMLRGLIASMSAKVDGRKVTLVRPVFAGSDDSVESELDPTTSSDSQATTSSDPLFDDSVGSRTRATPLSEPREGKTEDRAVGVAHFGQTFEEFYSVYPRKKEPDAARRAWDKATKKTTPAMIVAGARRFADERAGEDPRYTPYPASWLNAGGWKDEPDVRGPSVSKSTKSLAAWAARNDQEAIG